MFKLKGLIWSALLFIFSLLTSFQASAQKDLVISGGTNVSSFVCENRTAYVWGSNNNNGNLGQLGVGSSANYLAVPTPVPIPGNPDVKQINSGSGSHFVALTCSGDVWAWGTNSEGQVGTGATSGMFGIVPTPTRVIANAAIPATHRNAAGQLINATVVYAGTSNSFAILNNGRLVSWGLNSGGSAGQLGQGTTTDAYTANYVLTGPGTPLTGVTQIFAGDNVAYALVDPDGDGVGTVYSWGNGLNGTLGRNAAGTGNPSTATTNNGGTVQDSYARPVYYVDGTQMNNIQQLQAGDVFGIALDVNNYIWTWGNGGWNSSTGNVNNATTSAPRKVIAGTTTGASNDGTFLLAKAIGGGQGYGMAVTIDGKPVAWGGGGCGNGGATGNGTLTGSASGPQYIQYAAGLVHDNVTLINRGDLWGFYGTSNNEFYAWGCNGSSDATGMNPRSGVLGIGNNIDQPYATRITPPSGCDFRDPAPFADLRQDDISVCQAEFNPPGLVLNSGFTILPSIASKYTITWKRNGVNAKTPGPASIASNLTYTATQDGTYRVEIEYTGANAGCQVYDVAFDEMTITYFTPSFTVPTNLTFCGTTATVNVNSTNAASNPVYAWYPTASSTTELGRTVGSGSTTISTTALTGTTTKTVYVEEIRQKKGTFFTTVGPITDGSNIENHDSYIETTSAISLDSLAIYLRSYNPSPAATFTGRVQIYGNKSACGSKVVADKTQVLYQGPVFTVSTSSSTFVSLYVPVNVVLPPGKYFIGYSSVSVSNGAIGKMSGAGAGFANSGADLASNTGVSDNVGGTTVKFYGSDEGDCFGSAGYAGYNSNFQFSIPQGYCNRLPVTLTEACPCSRPTNVTITTPAAATLTICQGTAQTLSGTVTVPAAPQNTAFTYSWRKVGTATPLQTATITPTIATAFAVPNYTGITGALTDAGQYILRIEDGNTNSPSCFRDDTLTLVVNATTVPGVIAAAQTICTGENPAAFTVTTAASGGTGTFVYQWERSVNGAAYGDIATATNATYDEGVLTNATALPATHDYRRKVTSGVCPQVTSNAIRITVNPAVVAGAVGTDETVCSGGNPAAFTQTTATTGGGGSGTYTYQWQSASALAGTYTNIAGATTATYDPPTGITATTFYRRVDGSGGCTTVNTNVVTVTVPAALVPGTVTANQTICYNTIPTAFASTAAATGGNGTFAYQWQVSATSGGVFTDIAGATNATYAPAAALTVDRFYRRQVTSGTVATCNVANTTEIRVTVSPNFVVGSIGGTQTVCQTTGDPTTLTSVTLPTGGQTVYTYQWKSGTTLGGPYTNIAGATNATYNPPAGLTATTYFVREDISAGGCGTLTTNEITVTVTPTVVPDVIIATPSTTICSGESITFTATPTNGGTTPTYQWRKNTTPIALATNATYTTTGAANGDSYDVIMTSTANCASPATATSNAIVMTVTTVVTPAVTITALPAGPICAGTSVTFTASPGNGGALPTYQWQINGVNSGAVTTTATFTPAALANGNTVSVIMTSNSGCVVAPGTATSNVITMVVNPIPTPSVAASVSPTGAICAGASLTFTAAPTQGGTTPTYVWKKNGTAIAGATNVTYTTITAANNDSYTVEMVSNATCAPTTAVASTAIVITVNPILVPSVTVSGTPTTICTNGSVTFTATPTNEGTAPTYQWYINGGAVGAAGPSATFTTTALTLSTDQVEVRLLSNALCANPLIASASTSVTVNLGIGAGTIGSTQTICYNTIPAAITQTAAPTNIVGTPTYQWEASATASGTYTAIPGATNISYTPTLAMTVGGFIRRVITDPGTPAPCNTATSNAVEIIVRPILVAGTVGADETICSGIAPATMNQITAPTGGTGAYTYQWESDASGGVFGPIAGATNSSYTSPAITATTRFQRIETSGACGSVTSNIVTKAVTTPEVVTAVIDNAATQVCASTPSIVFTANGSSTTGTGTLSYEWFLGGPSNPVGTNSPTYTYTPVLVADNGKQVTVKVTTSTGCNTGAPTSAPYTLDIVNAITPTITISGNPINCAGLVSTFALTSTGGGTAPGPTYQWYVNSSANPVGTGGTTFSTSTLVNGDRVYVEMTSSSNCLAAGLTNPFKSNEITMQIKPIPAPSIIEGNQAICSPNTFTFHGNVTPGNSYEWRNGTTVVGTSADLTIGQSGTYTLYEDNGTCNSTSQPVTLDVVQTPVANAGADIYMKEGEAGSLNGSGGSVYSWSPATYLNNASISNPSFTATSTITYILTVSNTSGTTTCPATDDVTVFVVKPIIVPNVITVNGDGSNDDWYLENIEGYPNAIIEIYNRWGNLVWKSEGYPKNWDGTNYRNGEVLADGTYFYIIDLKSQVYPEPLTGWIQIMK